MMQQKQPPKFLNLLRISLPVTALTSLLHRLTGLLMFIFLPVLIYGLSLSVSSESHFLYLQSLFESLFVRIIVLLMLWALVHHFFAGLRFLLMDIDIGISLTVARFSAWLVNIAGILLMLWVLKDLLL